MGAVRQGVFCPVQDLIFRQDSSQHLPHYQHVKVCKPPSPLLCVCEMRIAIYCCPPPSKLQQDFSDQSKDKYWCSCSAPRCAPCISSAVKIKGKTLSVTAGFPLARSCKVFLTDRATEHRWLQRKDLYRPVSGRIIDLKVPWHSSIWKALCNNITWFV